MILNEASAHGRRCIINRDMAAIYVHVDDHIVVGHSPKRADELLSMVVHSLLKIGFTVSQQTAALETERAVGYDHSANPARL